jgi:hypothetical protein
MSSDGRLGFSGWDFQDTVDETHRTETVEERLDQPLTEDDDEE